MPAATFSTRLTSDAERDVLKARMRVLAERNPSWGIAPDDWKKLWPYLAVQKITYLYDDELKEHLIFTDSKLTGKGEELLDAYMVLDEEDEIQLKLWQFKFTEKWDRGISTVDLYAFVDRMNRVFLKTDLQEPETLEAFREIQAAVELARKGRRGRKPVRVQCYYAVNGQSLSPSDAPKLNQLRDTYSHERQAYGFTFEAYSGNDLYQLCAHGRIPIQEEVIELNNEHGSGSFLHHLIGKNPNGMPEQVAVGFVNVNQLIRLVDRYSNNELFEKNVRFFLGSGRDVNERIIETVTSNHSPWFGFMNNGVSIVADSMEVLMPPSGKRMKVKLGNMQIINGCQTVNALYHAKYDAGLKDRFQGNSNVLVRIYQVDPENTDFLEALIIATNSQNAISPEDLIANDARQRTAQSLLHAYGVFYQRKEGEIPPGSSRLLVFSKEQAALAWLAVFKGYTSQLRNSSSKREIFRKSGSEDNDYNTIFGPYDAHDSSSVTAQRRALEMALACILHQEVGAEIEKAAASRRERGPLRKAAYYLCSAIYTMGESRFAALLGSISEEAPAPSAVTKLRREAAGAVKSRFQEAAGIFIQCRESYLKRNHGSEDAALKNRAFAEEVQAAVKVATQQPYLQLPLE